MKIQTALEGREVCDQLRNDLRKIRYNPDLIKMLKNIETMVTQLSKLEVECRRSSNRVMMQEPLENINSAVKHLTNLILMAKLMD